MSRKPPSCTNHESTIQCVGFATAEVIFSDVFPDGVRNIQSFPLRPLGKPEPHPEASLVVKRSRRFTTSGDGTFEKQKSVQEGLRRRCCGADGTSSRIRQVKSHQTIFSRTPAMLERGFRNLAVHVGRCLKQTTSAVASVTDARKSDAASPVASAWSVTDDGETARRFLLARSADDQSRVHMLVPSLVARSLSFLQYWSLGAQRIVGFPSICTPMNRKCPLPARVPHLSGRCRTAAIFLSLPGRNAGASMESLWTREADTVISVTSRRCTCLREATTPSATKSLEQ